MLLNKQKYKLKQILAAYLAVIVMLITSLLCGGAGFGFAWATTIEGVTDFENSDVLEDLQGAKIEGETFNLKDYGFDSTKETQVFDFVEYCYSCDVRYQANYALYIYVYNPQGIAFDYESALNKIQLKTGDIDQGNYVKYSLKFLNVSGQEYEGLFLKYKVVLSETTKKEILKELNSDERVYNVSGIELLTKGEKTAKEYYIATTYTYKGYVDGYGVSSNEKLSCTRQSLDVAKLNVQGTYYRYPQSTSDYLATSITSTQLNTVYFAVDNKYIRKFGTIYRIWAEYWQYQLAPILVTSDDTLYNSLQNAPADLETLETNSDFSLSGYYKWGQSVATKEMVADWIYGKGSTVSFFGNKVKQSENCVFYTKKLLSFKNEDPRNAVISREQLEAEMYTMAESTGAKQGQLNEYVLTGGTGYVSIDLTADDLFDLKGFNAGSDLANWWHGLWGLNNSDIPDIQPIVDVKADDLLKEDISSNLLIAEEDVSAFKLYCKENMAQDKTVFLFRYGTSEYKEEPVYVKPVGVTWVFSELDNQSVRFQTIDKDFDIIQLGFGNEKQIVVVPVVASPINNLASSTGSVVLQNGENCANIDWKTILMIALVVVFVIVFINLFHEIIWDIVKWTVKAVVWIVVLPFKLIKMLIDDIQKRRKKKSEQDEAEEKEKDLATSKKKNQSKDINKNTSGSMPQRTSKSQGGKAKTKRKKAREKVKR